MTYRTAQHRDSLSSTYLSAPGVARGVPRGNLQIFTSVLHRLAEICAVMSGTWYGITGLHVGVAAVGVMLGRAQVLNLLAPFGLAYMFAVLYWRRPLAVSALVGVAAGQMWLGGWNAALQQAMLLALFWLMAELTGGVDVEPGSQGSPQRLLPAAGGAAAVVRGFAWFGRGPTFYYLCLFAFELVIMLCSCIVFCRGVGSILGCRSLRRPGKTAGGQQTGEIIGVLLAVTIFASVVLMGMSGWEIGGQRALWIFALLAIMLGAAVAGPWGGLAAGTIMGAVLGMAVQLDVGLAAALAAGGLLAGLGARRGRFWAPVALIMPALALYGMFSARPGWVFSPWEMIFAVGLYALICMKIPSTAPTAVHKMAAVERAATAEPAAGDADPGGQQSASEEKPTKGFAGAGNDGAGQLLGRLLRGNSNSAETTAAERMKAFARVFRRLADSFSEVEQGQLEQSSSSDMVARVAERTGSEICRGCQLYQECWQEKFMRTYHQMSKILLRMDIGHPPTFTEIEADLREFCSTHPRKLFQVMHTAYKTEQIKCGWSARFAETKDLTATQLRGLAQIMDDLAWGTNEDESRSRRKSERETQFRYEVGIADLAHGKGPSGDTHLVRKLNGDQLVVMLSDGMGGGDRAAQESRAAVSLLEELLSLGLDRDSALKTVNSVLVLRSTEDVFATVDMMSIDLCGGEAEFTKIGAAPTFVKRGREMLTISSGVVPIGILSEVSLDSATRKLHAGDIVVMMTDGIMAALGSLTETQKKTWLSRFLSGCGHSSAEDLATALVAQAVSFCPDGPPDDMTVVAVLLQSR